MARAKPKLPPEVRAFFARTGAEGGRKGKGRSKRRGTSEHYRQLALKSAAARRRKRN